MRATFPQVTLVAAAADNDGRRGRRHGGRRQVPARTAKPRQVPRPRPNVKPGRVR